VTLRRHFRPFLVLLLVAAPGAASAQVPGESVYEERRSLREEYRAVAYEEVKQSVAEWVDNLNAHKLNELRKGVTSTVYFAPVGWNASGLPSFTDSLTRRLPALGGFHFTLLDFDASGSLAYALADVRYHVDPGSGAMPSGDVNVEAVIVFFRAGPRWKIRSYLERTSGG
jgi:ketosteroid isomerase-like protein